MGETHPQGSCSSSWAPIHPFCAAYTPGSHMNCFDPSLMHLGLALVVMHLQVVPIASTDQSEIATSEQYWVPWGLQSSTHVPPHSLSVGAASTRGLRRTTPMQCVTHAQLCRRMHFTGLANCKWWHHLRSRQHCEGHSPHVCARVTSCMGLAAFETAATSWFRGSGNVKVPPPPSLSHITLTRGQHTWVLHATKLIETCRELCKFTSVCILLME
jgi:hypothetical protein